MKEYNFPIIIESDKDGYFASCPKLQGCYSQGDTYEEAMKNIKDAVNLHMEFEDKYLGYLMRIVEKEPNVSLKKAKTILH